MLLSRIQEALASSYLVERELGRGGMAVVFLGRDLRHDRDVAIKVLLPELAASVSPERFNREIRIAANLQHPMILPLFDSGETDGLLFYVMPYVQGESLRDRIERPPPMPLEECLQLGREVAEALAHAHDQGVVHRDIKPDNILLSGGHPLLADFGVASAVSMDETSNLTGTGLILGSPRYMSPEQAMSESSIDARSDIYALGCVIYEMLAGKPPFDSPNLPALLIQHMETPPPDITEAREGVSVALRNTLETALAKDPEDRFQDATAFADALRAPETLTVRAPTMRRRGVSRRAVAATLVAGAALAATAWAASRDWGGPIARDLNLIAIAPFVALDASLEPWSQGVLDNLSRNLNGAGPLRAVSPSDAMREWSGRADEASATRLAERTGAGLGIFGTVNRSGADSVRLTASVLDVDSRRIAGEVAINADVNRLDVAVDSLTVQLLRTLNLVRPLGVVQLESFGSAPIPAIKAFLSGEHYFRRTAWDSAGIHFERAAELDSTFAMALHRIFQVRYLKGTGQDSLIWDYAIRAGRLKDRLGLRESLLVTADSLTATILMEASAADSLNEGRRLRLLSVLDEATRRFPDDPEVWFQLGLARDRIAWTLGEPEVAVLDAFDRSIALDSLFGPSLVLAIESAMLVKGEDWAKRYLTGYLAVDPIGPHADALRLTGGLIDPTMEGTAAVEATLDTASALFLYQAAGPLQWWPDPGHTHVRLTRLLTERPHDPRVAANPRIITNMLVMSLAWRGRVEEAYDEGGRRPYFFLGQLAVLGGVPDDVASQDFRTTLGGAGSPPDLNASFGLPWWASRGDTTALQTLISNIDVSRTSLDALEATEFAYLRSAAEAYLALTRRDSTMALERFLALPDVSERLRINGIGEWEAYQTVRLLNDHSRHEEASARLSRMTRATYFALDILLMNERGRVAEALGDREAALFAYSSVTQAWVDADPPLQPIVNEAFEATARLLEPRSGEVANEPSDGGAW